MELKHLSRSRGHHIYAIVFATALPFLVWLSVFHTVQNLFSHAEGTYVVNSTGDTLDAQVGDGLCADATGHCTLRAAVSEANFAPNEDTILLGAEIYQLVLAGALEDSNNSGDLDILTPVRIVGQGAESTFIQAGTNRENGIDRILHVQGNVGSLVLEGVTLRYGRTPDGVANHEGGAIRNYYGTVVIRDSVICCSRTGDGFDMADGGNGGGISGANGSIAIYNTAIFDNVTGVGGNRNDGLGSAGFGGSGGGLYANATAVTIAHSQICQNRTGDGGTGSNGTNGGDSGFGGGLSAYFGFLQVVNTAVFSNTTGNGGAVLGTGMGGFSGDGGGLHLHGGAVVRNSVVFSNTIGIGNPVNGDGGGMDINYFADIHIINSTISGNYGARFGGGIQSKTAEVTIHNSTLSGNQASNGGGIYLSLGNISMENSVVTHSTPNDCVSEVVNGITGQNNLVDDYLVGACSDIAHGAVTHFDPILRDNGGSTWTHALWPGSNAVDNGVDFCPDQTGTPLTVDQREFPRPEGPHCDIGAFEKSNLAPIAVSDFYTMDEDLVLMVVAPGVLANDSDPEDSPLTTNLLHPPGAGGVTLGEDGAFDYVPEADWYGEDAFVYVVSDGQLTSTATVHIDVSPVNDPPLALDDGDDTDVNTAVTTAVLFNDSDKDGNLVPASLAIITQPLTGSLAIDPTWGTITYTPDDDFLGEDSYVYEICDDGTPLPPACDEAVVTIAVLPVNTPPIVLAGDDQTAHEGQTVAFNGEYTDPDDGLPGYPVGVTILWDFGDDFFAQDTLTPTHVFQDNGIFTVTLTVTDRRGGSTRDSLLVEVENVAPTVQVSGDLTGITAVPISFTGTFTDPGNDTHTILWLFGDGTTQLSTLAATHPYARPGTYTVTLSVTDDDGGIGEATLLVFIQTKIYLPVVFKASN